MNHNLRLPSVIITLAMIAVTIYFVDSVFILNTDYGASAWLIQFLTILLTALTLVMIGGCYMQYRGVTQEKLEEIAAKHT